MAFGISFSKIFTTPKFKKRKYDPDIIEAADIELPAIYKSFDDKRIMRDIKSELNTYKSLGYRFKDKGELQKKDYHSFQIGILLCALNKNIDLNIPNNKNYLPQFIVSSNIHIVKKDISDIIKKFNKEVDKDISEIIAKDEFIWTPIEAGCILYYLSIFKNLNLN